MIAAALTRLRAEGAFIVLAIVAAIGAWLYVGREQARADRDDIAHRAELICTASGTGFAAQHGVERGAACQARVAALVQYQQHSAEIAAQQLAQAMKDHDARQMADNRAALATAQAANAATARMEAAEQNAQRTNLVGRDWYAALNGFAGLRPPAGPSR